MNSIMKNTLAMLVLATIALSARADIVQVRGTAMPSQIASAQDTNLTVQWQVFADSSPFSAISSQGQFIDPVTNTVLTTQPTTVSGTGNSPLLLSESLLLAARQIQIWQEQGLSRIVYKRVFNDPTGGGANVSGGVTISLRNANSALSRELTPELVIQRMSLHFNELQSYAVVETGSVLNATLTIEYRGQGRLNGRWLWAYDDGSDTELQFRTLQVVQQNLSNSQRYQLVSPALNTRTTGSYRVRFCLATATLDDCAQPQVEATYQVMDGAVSSVSLLPNVTPRRGAVNAQSRFQWPQVKGGVVYQLQLFQQQGSTAEFVTGMWLPKGSTGAVLSPLVRSKLKTGASYLWRITVFDENGNPLARSEDAEVIWQP